MRPSPSFPPPPPLSPHLSPHNLKSAIFPFGHAKSQMRPSLLVTPFPASLITLPPLAPLIPPFCSPSPRHPLRSRNHAFLRIRNKSVTDGRTDRRTDGRTDKVGYTAELVARNRAGLVIE